MTTAYGVPSTVQSTSARKDTHVGLAGGSRHRAWDWPGCEKQLGGREQPRTLNRCGGA